MLFEYVSRSDLTQVDDLFLLLSYLYVNENETFYALNTVYDKVMFYGLPSVYLPAQQSVALKGKYNFLVTAEQLIFDYNTVNSMETPLANSSN